MIWALVGILWIACGVAAYVFFKGSTRYKIMKDKKELVDGVNVGEVAVFDELPDGLLYSTNEDWLYRIASF